MKGKKNLQEELIGVIKEFRDLFREINENLEIDDVGLDFFKDFFKDYNSSYSLSLAYPESMWKLTAENAGIDTEGKDRLQLAQELFSSVPDRPLAKPISESDVSDEPLDEEEQK